MGSRRNRPRTQVENAQTYSKPPITTDEAAYRLWQRRLNLDDRKIVDLSLDTIGYYRLLIFMRKYQYKNGDFKKGTSFHKILTLYNFDRDLRAITFDAIERLEVALRTTMGNEMAIKYSDSHWFQKSDHFSSEPIHNASMKKIKEATEGKSLALDHYYRTYSHPVYPPVWLVFEKLTFGQLSTIFSGLKLEHRKHIALIWGFAENVLTSWFRSLSNIRNICAHHDRLWNGSLTINPPVFPSKNRGDLGDEYSFYNRACVICLLLTLLKCEQAWKNKLIELFEKYPDISPQKDLGFIDNWASKNIWNSPDERTAQSLAGEPIS